MAANPIVIPRHERSSPTGSKVSHQGRHYAETISLMVLAIGFALTQSWSRRWVTSGAAVESILLIYSPFESLHLWTLLAVLNFTFALSSTSWLLRPMFVIACYVMIVFTCFGLFPALSNISRKKIRERLHQVHLWGDKIAFFRLPALEIDTGATGRFVVRGITLGLLDLTIQAHGIELGLRLRNDIELTLCLDHIIIKLFRHIDITDVYSNLKVEESGETLNDFKQFRRHDESLLLEAITTDSDPRHSGQPRTTVPIDDSQAERQYDDAVKQVEESSQIYIARCQVEQGDDSNKPKNEREMRQAICAKLQDVPSVSHTPRYAVTVSSLQQIFPRVRKFLHRFPFLLRLLLNQLSYFHPINISSASVAGSGERLKGLLQDYLFKDQATYDADIKQLEEEMSSWLSSASFCLEIADLAALAHVPFKASGEITTYVRSANVSIYRTPLDSNTVRQVIHIGGADGTFVVPGFLLPHHEHCLPALPTGQAGPNANGLAAPGSNVDITKEAERDETGIIISVHASLPTHFDQSLLDFAATLAKATKLIDVESLFEQESTSEVTSSEEPTAETDSENANSSQTETNASGNHTTDDSEQSKTKKKFASRARQTFKDGLKKGLKNNTLGDKINDRWVARTVGKIAAKLEHAQGDFGYTTTVPLSLKPYRPTEHIPSKIWP